MSTMVALREQLVDIRNSHRGVQGGLGNYNPDSKRTAEWLEWGIESADSYRKLMNKAINTLDEIVRERA